MRGRKSKARQSDPQFSSLAAGTRSRTTFTGWLCFCKSLDDPSLPGRSWRLGSRMVCSHSTPLSAETRLLLILIGIVSGGFSCLSCRPLLLYSSCQAEKRYVTHDLREQGTEVWKLLEQGAHLYVCGDAKMMAKVPTLYIFLIMVGRWQGRKSNRRMSISCSC